ncbi:putative NRPS-like protein biosynthetic cluster [Aspergillus pseudoviridinutans]|uniref:NRPS-like protein biosynthetic cluster n=1 Tax=Aspergillus pseudoviridinutans TaxID=1517512 RepID=A0A9P3EPZ4_9EURO|nr:putative NRPS-like protein biosynthetic cluster [Aspergillus pseudoviridinutans]GIJ83244.1 putative NRPS-like protein biosynthetic cluster [Aspergillus pseudoviridinutans]
MEAEACVLPVNDGEKGQDREQIKEVSIGRLALRTSFDDTLQDGLFSVLILAWALVLRRFTDMDDVRFAVHSTPTDKTVPKVKERSLQICEVSIPPEVNVRRFFEEVRYKMKQWQLELASEVNTVVVLGHEAEEVKEDVGLLFQSGCKQQYDLAVVVRTNESMSETSLYYRTAAVSKARAKRLAGNVAQALKCLIENPEQIFCDMNFCGPEDYQQIAQWNSAPNTEAAHEFVDDIILKHAVHQPTVVAVHSWDGDLTYAELHNLSSELAAHLQSLRVEPGDPVPLCMEKSLWTIVSILAVIKSGAVFVPLEASQPVKRLENIIAQLKGGAIIASPQHAAALSNTGRRVVSVSRADMEQLPSSDHAVTHRTPTDMAYILFTSGSTGAPKGCVMEHRALTGFARHVEPLQVESNSRVLQFASYGVHASLVEIFCSLTAGATLCIPSAHERMNDLQGAIERMNISWTLMTPSTLKTLDTKAMGTVQTIIIGAEPIPKDAYEDFEGSFRLLIGYGMTEWGGILTAQKEGTRDTKNIGSPFLGRIWLVEPLDHHRLAPVGAVAELVVEGPYLARGYLDDHQKTSETFIVNPSWLIHFSTEPSRERIFYKTGDLVQYAEDGTLCYVGRKDNQVKLRGYRIELGEVEYHLRQCWDRAEDVILTDVVTPTDNSATPSLTAFIWDKEASLAEKLASVRSMLFMIPDEQFRTRVSVADSKLRAALPAHMVPTIYIPLSHVPMTFSRKIDRRTLRMQAAMLDQDQLLSYRTGEQNGKHEKAMPRSDTEKALHRMFALLLNLDETKIGVNDSFYNLGGDSIGSMQLVSMCRAEDIPLSVEDLFEKETIAELAAAADQNRLR